MSRRIPQSFIDELIARADVVDVVGARVALKKAGRDYKGLCPFHDEKTPSFTVSASKGFYHCFGCGAHGTALGFLMSYENLPFPEAVETLAGMLSMTVPHEADAGRDDRSGRLYEILREADQIFRRGLREHQPAIRYLKDRGIQGSTAARFGIGYAPAAWDTLLGQLGTSPDAIAALSEAGLIVEAEGGRRYDRFRDRIMFPIRDARGRVIGFGGRLLGDGEPKYLNSPETPVFHKGKALYGIYEARQTKGRPAELIVVEGYLDAASLVQQGIEPVVAALGTATTAEHVRQLTRLSDRVVFCFDGDRAGRAAAWRAMETALPQAGGVAELRFLLLPEGEDPDSLVQRSGPEAFRAQLAESLPLSKFMIGELQRQVDVDNAEGRARFAALARPLLARVPAGVYRQALLEELAAGIGVAPDTLGETLGPKAASGASRPAQSVRAVKKGRSTLLRKAIVLALHYPAIAARVGPAAGLGQIDQPGVPLLRRILAAAVELAAERPQITMAGLLERLRDDPDRRYLDELMRQAPLDDEEGAADVLQGAVERIIEQHRRAAAAEALRQRRNQ